MTNLKITVDIAPLVYELEQIHQDQIPFAASRAINDVALIVQKGQQNAMRTNFTIRKTWVLNGIIISKFSTKKDNPIQAVIEIAPDRSFLAKFEAGGTKVPRGQNIAVPTTAVRPGLQDIAPDNIRPRALSLGSEGKGNQRTFLITNGPGKGIWQRIGKGPRNIKLLWSFVHSARISALLGMGERAQGLVAQWFNTRFYIRLDEAIASRKPR